MYNTRSTPNTKCGSPIQCSVNDLNGVTENNQIKHELRK